MKTRRSALFVSLTLLYFVLVSAIVCRLSPLYFNASEGQSERATWASVDYSSRSCSLPENPDRRSDPRRHGTAGEIGLRGDTFFIGYWRMGIMFDTCIRAVQMTDGHLLFHW